MNEMKKYYLKLTTLTPVHIGTGEVYEPTNFVIDDGYLYEFDEVLFFRSLSENEQKQFADICKKDDETALYVDIHRFIKAKKDIVKKIAHNKVPVTKMIENDYKQKVANIVQVEGEEKEKVFNKFEIQKMYRDKNYQNPSILGSSFKGALSTAYQEMLYKAKNNWKEVEYAFEIQHLFKNLSVSDALPIHYEDLIAYAVNKERFEEDNAQISTIIEVILNDSQFLMTLDIKDLLGDDDRPMKYPITLKAIKEACNRHYLPLWDSMFNEKISLSKTFIEKYKDLKLQENQFLIRIGKHSGARAVTIDGMRKILIKLAQIQNTRKERKINFEKQIEKRLERLKKKSFFENKDILKFFVNEQKLEGKEKGMQKSAFNFLKHPERLERRVRENSRVTINAFLNQETTIWVFGKDKQNSDFSTFGWVLCEIIDENEYKKLQSQTKHKKATKKEILQRIQEEIEKQKLLQEEQKRKKELEEQAKQKALQEEKERLAKMSPLDRKIYELQKSNPNPNETIDIILFNAIKRGEFGEMRCEALQRLKEEMIKLKKWVETSKKPEKDKKYKRTQEVIKMLEECKK